MLTNKDFSRGLRAGIPIGAGYFSVSLSFGILAASYGFPWWQAVVISMVTVTSAGQFAGISAMLTPGQYFPLLLSQVTINIRYSMMSVSLSQRADATFGKLSRWLLGFFMTDEIFAVAAGEPVVKPRFFAGLTVLPWIGWTLGTLSGGLLGSILPAMLMDALSVALYGMFIAIVVPVAKKEKPVLLAVGIAALCSCLFTWLPGLKTLPSGISVSLCAILAAAVAAAIFPVKEETA